MLQLRSVTKCYGALTALDGISLDLARGEFFGLLGPNGAGKSTAMSLIAGLRAPDSGSITLDGESLTAANSTGTPSSRSTGSIAGRNRSSLAIAVAGPPLCHNSGCCP